MNRDTDPGMPFPDVLTRVGEAAAVSPDSARGSLPTSPPAAETEPTRQTAALRADLAKLREQIAELSATVSAIQQRLNVLDRDNLRSEQRDRELLEVVHGIDSRVMLALAGDGDTRASLRRPLLRRLLGRRASSRCS